MELAFGSEACPQDISNAVVPDLIQHGMDGYNATLVVTGHRCDSTVVGDPSMPGVLSCLIEELFDRVGTAVWQVRVCLISFCLDLDLLFPP